MSDLSLPPSPEPEEEPGTRRPMHGAESTDVPLDVITRLRAVCLGLPEAYEEPAWVGTRWRIRKRTFAHVLVIESGWPPVYARAAADDGPVTVITFRSSGGELAALSASGRPFFKPLWPANMVGMILDADSDWAEVNELLTESYRVLAPKKLVHAAGWSTKPTRG